VKLLSSTSSSSQLRHQAVLRPVSASDCRFVCERRACSSHRVDLEDVGSRITRCESVAKCDMVKPRSGSTGQSNLAMLYYHTQRRSAAILAHHNWDARCWCTVSCTNGATDSEDKVWRLAGGCQPATADSATAKYCLSRVASSRTQCVQHVHGRQDR
jgi:hypothetical protein